MKIDFLRYKLRYSIDESMISYPEDLWEDIDYYLADYPVLYQAGLPVNVQLEISKMKRNLCKFYSKDLAKVKDLYRKEKFKYAMITFEGIEIHYEDRMVKC